MPFSQQNIGNTFGGLGFFSSMMWEQKLSMVFTLACPNRFDTVMIFVPSVSRTEDIVWRNAWGDVGQVVAG